MGKEEAQDNLNEASDETTFFNRGLEEEACARPDAEFENL